MRTIRRGACGLAIAVACLLLTGLAGCASSPCTSCQQCAHGFSDDRSDALQVLSTRVGTKNVFIPSTLVVTVGDARLLSVFNDTDTPHGFRIPGLGVEAMLEPGKETTITLSKLDRPGVYAINCHLHPPHRNATLVVLPAAQACAARHVH
jgi:heme/copper-type cytochrome/quinol oxidase subunit 2